MEKNKIRLCAFSDEAAVNFEEQINALKKNNIGRMEIRNVDGKSIADLSLQEVESCSKQLKKAKIEVFSIGSPLGKSNLSDPFEAEERRLLDILKKAEILETDKIRVFSFFTKNYDIDVNVVIDRMKKMTEISATVGVKLFHENEKDIYGDLVKRVKFLLDNVSLLGSVFDPANYVQCGEDISSARLQILTLADYIHIKDVKNINGKYVNVAAGEGVCQIKEIISSLHGEVTTTIEPHLAEFIGFSNLENGNEKVEFMFKDCAEPFDYAVMAYKKILNEIGYAESDGCFLKAD